MTSLFISPGLSCDCPDSCLLPSLLMTAATLWSSVGLYHALAALVPQTLSPPAALLGGFGSFVFIFSLYLAAGVSHRDKMTITLAAGLPVSCVFEIASLWTDLRQSVAAYFLLLAAICFYIMCSILINQIRSKKNNISNSTPENKEVRLLSLGHAMNTMAAAVYAGALISRDNSAAQGFSWLLVSGLCLVVLSVVATRYSSTHVTINFFLHGLVWFINGINSMLSLIEQVNIPYFTASTTILFLAFIALGIMSFFKDCFQVVHNGLICILCVAVLIGNIYFIGIMGIALFISSLYILAAHLYQVYLPNNQLLTRIAKIKGPDCICFSNNVCSRYLRKRKHLVEITSSIITENFPNIYKLGYSHYKGFEVVGFVLNAITSVAVLWSPAGMWPLLWALVFGTLSQLINGAVAFSQGMTFESCAYFTFGVFWAIWGSARGYSDFRLNSSSAIIAGFSGFITAILLLLVLSFAISKTWTLMLLTFQLVVLGYLLNSMNVFGSFYFEAVVTILFSIVCFYCFFAYLIRDVSGKEILPLGKPHLQLNYLHSQGNLVFWADGRRSSGVKSVAGM